MTAAERVVFEHVTKRYPGTGKGNPGAGEGLSREGPAGPVCVRVGPAGGGQTPSRKMVNRLIEQDLASITV
jgi:ABC-type proline/glycine betaine transport system ATPase subunit